MRWAIFSDIHSNSEALHSVLLDAARQRAESYVCLGDIVGYNADPVECLQMVQDLKCPVVMGNHDEASTHKRDLPHFQPLAMSGITHTRKSLNPAQIHYLSHLPMTLEFKTFSATHASLFPGEKWLYVTGQREVWHSIQHQTKPLCFIGHTHDPKIFLDDQLGVGSMAFSPNARVVLPIEPKRKFLINVGSVGQPRDGDSRASYVIYDDELHSVELRRVEYDLASAQQKILKAELPEVLAARLSVGR